MIFFIYILLNLKKELNLYIKNDLIILKFNFIIKCNQEFIYNIL